MNLDGKILTVLNGNYCVGSKTYEPSFSLLRYNRGIRDETQAKNNNLLQTLSQEFVTFCLTMHDFTFHPVFRHLNIYSKSIQ